MSLFFCRVGLGYTEEVLYSREGGRVLFVSARVHVERRAFNSGSILKGRRWGQAWVGQWRMHKAQPSGRTLCLLPSALSSPRRIICLLYAQLFTARGRWRGPHAKVDYRLDGRSVDCQPTVGPWKGGGGGSPMWHVDFKIWQCRKCHMSNIKKGYVPCHFTFTPNVACHKAARRMSNKKCHWMSPCRFEGSRAII